ncbi:MAG: DNA replication protein, partial [Sneathiella sp.]
MKAVQIPLDLTYRAASGRNDFLVAAPNEEAVAWIDQWPDWPGGFLAIVGPAGCGKTHLTRVWQARAEATIINPNTLGTLDINDLADLAANPLICEDMETDFDEEAFLHLYNI